jgi:hypothetical protein
MINDANKKRLDNLEQTCKDQMLFLARSQVDVITDVYSRLRDLRQFIIGLSIAILGLVFPILMSRTNLLGVDYFIISFIEFCIFSLWGLISLIVPISKEVILLPAMTEHHTEEFLKMIKRVQEIRKIEDNNLAGQQYEKLEASYKTFDLPKASRIEIFFIKYQDIVLYSIFFVAFIFLLRGIFENMIF